MDIAIPSTVETRDRTVPLLLLAAVGAFCFLCVSALLVYTNTEHLVSSRDWRDHSQDVLTTLQLTSQRLDRIDYTTRLYLAAKNENDLDAARSTTIVLETGIVHLEDLVKDNPPQAIRTKSLRSCATDLKQQVNDLALQSASLSTRILDCRADVSKMQEYERTLLAVRIDDSRHSTYRSLFAGFLFLVLSLAVVLALFGLLLRDARRRRGADRQISQTNAQLAATILTLQKRAEEASLLMSAREELQLCTSPRQAESAAVRYCRQLLPATEVVLLLINNSRQLVEIASVSESETKLLDGFVLDACCGLRSGRMRWRKPGQSEIHCHHFLGTPPENYLCIPLTAHGETLGILYLEPSTAELSDQIEGHWESLEGLAEMAAMSIAGLRLRARLEQQSIRDGLTDLFNRHFMEISLDREVRRAVRKTTDLSVLMLDVDHFKMFNDTYGHEAGDLILRGIANIFRHSVRAEDIVCRYGGEEFVVILPETSTDLAFARAEDIRKQISAMRIRFHGDALSEVTISIGVASYPHSGSTLEELLRAADRALYVAKHKGRNQVVVAETVLATI